MHRRESIIIILLVLLSASYAYAAVKIDQQISNYDAAKSQILRNMAENSSYPILQNQHYQTILRLNSNFNRNRYYSPALGRFVSKDPIGFAADINLYRYAANNPICFTDPTGLIWVFNGWLNWTHSVIDYRDGKVISIRIPYAYNPITNTWLYKSIGVRYDYYVYTIDYWDYEMVWVPDFPACPITQPAGATKTGNAPRFLSIEGPFSVTKDPYFSDPKSIDPYKNASRNPHPKEFPFPSPSY